MAPPSTIPVTILLFARYAELLGQASLTVEVPPGGTVADAVALIRALPGGQALPPDPLVARNLEQVSGAARLSAGDELAFLPPMSGG